MTDGTKLGLLGWTATVLIAGALAYNLVGESLMRTVVARIERKAYYERIIAPRGLSLREAEFWEPVPDDSGAK